MPSICTPKWRDTYTNSAKVAIRPKTSPVASRTKERKTLRIFIVDGEVDRSPAPPGYHQLRYARNSSCLWSASS